MKQIELTEAELQAQYPMIVNHLNPDAPWAISRDRESDLGCMFETYGEELDFVDAQEPACIWTLLDGEDGSELIMSGRHSANRQGYFISETPVPDGTVITVITVTLD